MNFARTLLSITLLISTLVAAPNARAFVVVAPSEVLTQLIRQSIYLKALLPMVESQDLPRVRHLLQLNIKAAGSLDTLGPLHQQTQEAMQIWAIAFSYSRAFWKSIESERGAVAIEAINAASDKIMAKSGLRAEAGSHVTQGLFRQMTETLAALEKLALPENLRPTIVELKSAFGRVLAIADAGDRPQTFAVAIPASQKLDAALEKLLILLTSSSTSEGVLQLQTLNELFKEFAQIRAAEGT